MKAKRLMLFSVGAFICNPIWSGFQRMVSPPMEESVIVKSFMAQAAPWQIGLFFFLVIVLVPMMEELVFRGALWWVLKKVAPDFVVAVLIAMVFSLAHGVHAALWLVPLSLVLSYLRIQHGLLHCIVVHCSWNAGAILLPWALQAFTGPLEPKATPWQPVHTPSALERYRGPKNPLDGGTA